MPEIEALTLSLAVRMGATALFVLAMSWLIARARPSLAAAAIAMPVVIGPGFFVMALERDPAFVMRAAEDALGALAGTVAFAGAVALLAGRLPRPVLLMSALLAWAACVSAAAIATGLTSNMLAFALAYGVGMTLLRAGPPQPAPRTVSWSPGAEGARALAAGTLVGAVTLAAGGLGPTLSGTLIALPVGLLFVAAGVLRLADATTARAVMTAGARGTAALALFLLVLRLLLGVGMPLVEAVVAATLASVGMALFLGLVLRVGRRSAH
jgi:hypothetical protein